MKDLLTIAAEEARRGMRKKEGGPFGAVIIYKNKIIAKAHNTVLKTKNSTCHAEINAISKASRVRKQFHLKDCIIFSTTEPCPMCFSAIHWARIKEIFYCTSIQDVKKLGFNELSISNRKLKNWGKTKVKITQAKNEDCLNILKEWKRMPQKKTY